MDGIIKQILDNELFHHGVRGMRWGIRKNRISSGSKGSSDRQKYNQLKKKQLKDLSNKELRELITRQQLERQYKDLNPNHVKKGMKIVSTVAATGTTAATIYGLSKSPLAKDTVKLVKTVLQK